MTKTGDFHTDIPHTSLVQDSRLVTGIKIAQLKVAFELIDPYVLILDLFNPVQGVSRSPQNTHVRARLWNWTARQ